MGRPRGDRNWHETNIGPRPGSLPEQSLLVYVSPRLMNRALRRALRAATRRGEPIRGGDK